MSFADVFGNDAAILARLTAIEAKTALIGTLQISGPTSPTIAGQLVSLNIGDDYLVANGREVEIQFASSITPATTTIKFTKTTACSNQASEELDVNGTVTASSGVVTCVYQINAADWDGVTSGSYEWTATVVDSSGDIITIRSQDQRVRYVEFR